MEDNLPYSKFTYLNVNLIQKHFHRNIQKMRDHISGHYSPIKLMYELTITGVTDKEFLLEVMECSKTDCGNG